MIAAGDLAAAVRAARLGPSAAVVVHPLGDGPVVRHGQGRLSPASMIKVPLAAAAALAIADAEATWDEPLRVEAANLTVNDAPSPLAAGVTSTIEELVALMLERSDNVATNVLIDRFGRERATTRLRAWGLAGTAIRRKLSGALPLIADPGAAGRNAHPAGDAAELLVRIARRRLPYADRLEAMLERQYWNAKLSAGLRPGDRFAHKTGDTDEVSHDGGILSLASGRRLVLVVYTALPSSDETDARIAAFMRALRPLLDP